MRRRHKYGHPGAVMVCSSAPDYACTYLWGVLPQLPSLALKSWESMDLHDFPRFSGKSGQLRGHRRKKKFCTRPRPRTTPGPSVAGTLAQLVQGERAVPVPVHLPEEALPVVPGPVAGALGSSGGALQEVKRWRTVVCVTSVLFYGAGNWALNTIAATSSKIQ